MENNRPEIDEERDDTQTNGWREWCEEHKRFYWDSEGCPACSGWLDEH